VKRFWFILLTVSVTSVIGAGAPAGELASKRGSNSAPVLDADAAANAGLSPKETQDARKLYTTKCMRCHKSYDPSGYSQPQWESWMTKMRKKARLAVEQDALLTRYLEAYPSGASVATTNFSARNVRSIAPKQ